MNKINSGQLGKVIYFDPNNVNIKGDVGDNLSAIFSGIEMIKDPSDFSIAVDLEVVNKVRGVVKNTKTNESYGLISSKPMTNFLQGTKLGGDNTLTNFFTDITYSGDDTTVQNEALCINSIDIEFSSWYVASVTIKFTDVRGSAIFSPSEYTENGGNNKKVSDGNLFSSFFTMPYPIFNLKIKGFYGDSVTYPLHLQDFKAEFNSEKNNFDITAQFIGYTYAMLSDIDMTYLISAPYSEVYGVEYWNEQINNGRFKTLEGTPLPKIPDLLRKIKEGEYITSRLDSTNEISEKINKDTTKNTYVNNIKTMINSYINALKSNYTVSGDFQTGFIVSTNDKTTTKLPMGSMELDTKVYPTLIKLVNYIRTFTNTYPDDSYFEKYKGDYLKNYFNVKNFKNINGQFTGNLNISEIINNIDLFTANVNNTLVELDKERSSVFSNSIVEIYQMVPSVYNFNKMLLAHMETLIHIIAACANDIDKNDNRVFTSDIESSDFIGNKVLPFPWYTISNQDAWIGKEHPNFKEVKLVKSMIKAKNDISLEISKLESIVPTSDINTEEVSLSVGDIWLPIHSFDNSITTIGAKTYKPYSKIIEENGADINELSSLLSNRIATILGLSMNGNYNDKLFRAYVDVEYENIKEFLGSSGLHIDRVIKSLDSIIANSELNDDNNENRNVFLRKYTQNGKVKSYEYNVLNTKGVIPLTNDTVASLKKKISNGKVISDFKYYYNGPGEAGISINYKSTNTIIVNGVKNCDYIYSNWYQPVELKLNDYPDLKDTILNRFILSKEESARSINNNPYSVQPMLNRIGYVKPIRTPNSANEKTINALEGNCGYKERGAKMCEVVINNTKGDITTFVFSDKNAEFGNLYKLYLGKNSWDEVKDLKIEKIEEIEELDMTKIFYGSSPDQNILTYPIIGGNYYHDIKNVGNRKFTKEEAYAGIGDTEFGAIMGEDLNITDSNMKPKITCLFGNKAYYIQNNKSKTAKLTKAFLFLQTLPIYVNDKMLELLKGDKFKSSFMIRIPKAEALLIGSMLWRRKNDPKNSRENYNENGFGDGLFLSNNIMRIPDTSRYFRINGEFTISNNHGNIMYDICHPIEEIKSGSKLESELISNFEKWVENTTDENDTWIKILNAFELKLNGTTNLTSDKFSKFIEEFKKNKKIEFVREKLGKGVYDNYSIIEPIDGNHLGLINRDKSKGISSVLSLLLNETIISYTGDAVFMSGQDPFDTGVNTPVLNDDKRRVDNFIRLLKSKLTVLKSTLNKDTTKLPEETEKSEDAVSKPEDDETTELAVYKYLKILYDKWVSGYEFNTSNSAYKWISTTQKNINGFNTYDIKNFKFVDRSYHNIGHKFIINYKEIFENLIGLTKQRTLYSVITDVLSKNNFLFLPMPNYQTWGSLGEFKKVFEPMSYSESNISATGDENTLTSVFLCMYTGEPSKRLNIKDDEYVYKNDSLSLNVEDLLDDDFSNSEEDKEEIMNMVPAFAISNGKQNQSYFKNIILNQNNPATTDASIGILKNLNDKNDKDSSVTSMGQDIYSLYSQFSYTCEVEMLGCAQIQPMMYFQLTNVPMWNGAYLIYKVKHSIKPGHMTTNFTGMRMGKTYPKLITQQAVSSGDLTSGLQVVAPKNELISNLSKSTKIGKYFTLGDYTVNETNIPEFIVSRIQNNLAPVVDSIADSWMVSNLNKGYGMFKINSGYRNLERNRLIGSDDSSQHVQGLAVDLQFPNSTKAKTDALFEHIKQRMKSGFKMDQLIKEPSDYGGWCHVSPIKYENLKTYVRGHALVFNKQFKTIKELSETIHEASGVTKITNPVATNNKFIEYWKSVENNKEYKSSGWNKNKNLWFAHTSPEGLVSGASAYDKLPTIAYGIKLAPGYLVSTELKLMNIADLQTGKIGISDQAAINEISEKANNALNEIKKYINKEYGVGAYGKIEEKYKYAMVDLHMNTGNINKFPKFVAAAVKNDLQGMIAEHHRDGVGKRNDAFVKFLKS